MNKQEAIEKLEYLKRLLEEGSKDSYNHEFINALKYTLNVVEQLKEPKKPVVPQFVADLYESIKDDFEVGTYKLFYKLYNCDLDVEILYWLSCAANKPIETLVKMKVFGYEVEKEKLYTVEIPNPNRVTEPITYLSRGEEGKIFLNTWAVYVSQNWKNQPHAQLTESEIKQDFEWAWPFAKEVKE